MRTKLDEIVEEEFESWRRCDTFSRHAAVKRIAERAFRYGVEQAHGVFAYLDHKNVQPAPAECKGHIHGGYRVPGTVCTCTPAEEKPRYVGLHAGSGRIDYVPDRRKGERRGHTRTLVFDRQCKEPYGPTGFFVDYENADYARIRPDRRSGKDRRK